jgi:hypothetical protein
MTRRAPAAAAALLAFCCGADAVLLFNKPYLAVLKDAVQARDADLKTCSVPAGTLVQVLGESNTFGEPRTGMVLVRAQEGPCAGTTGVVHPDRLTRVDPPPPGK